MRVASSEERGWGDTGTAGMRVRARIKPEHPSWLWGCTYVPASFCVCCVMSSITLQQSSTMTEEEEMRGYCCCVIGTEYMLSFLLLCCFYSLAFQMVQQRPLIFSQRDSDLVVRTPAFYQAPQVIISCPSSLIQELEGSVAGWNDDLASLRDSLKGTVGADDITVFQERLQLLQCQWGEVCHQVDWLTHRNSGDAIPPPPIFE